jgi:hypothetical protein
MKESKIFDVTQIEPGTLSVMSKITNKEIARYAISPKASFMLNAQLADEIISSFEKYFNAIRKTGNNRY